MATTGAQVTTKNTALTFATSAVSITDSDAGSNQMQETIIVNNGTLSLSGTTGLTFTVGNGTNNSSMVFTNSLILYPFSIILPFSIISFVNIV